MKGVNTIVINEEQLMAILQEWWEGFTYTHKDSYGKSKVVNIKPDEHGYYAIVLDEVESDE